MSEYDDIPLKMPDASESTDMGDSEPSEKKPGELGLALKRALAGSNGEAIEELLKKICDY